MSSVYTNALTNLLHAMALGAYFVLAWKRSRCWPDLYNGWVVAFFGLLLFLKCSGVLVHWPEMAWAAPGIWLAIAVGSCVAGWTALVAQGVSQRYLRGAIIAAVVLTVIGVSRQNFLFLACAQLSMTGVLAFQARGLLRLGWMGVIVSNLSWILMRQLLQDYSRKYAVDFVHIRYDNDIYHLMLIVSTYLLFRSVSLGLWQKKA